MVTMIFKAPPQWGHCSVLSEHTFDDRIASPLVRLNKLGKVFYAPMDVVFSEGPGENNKLPELAVAGQATCIITGDSDLLDLHPFRAISIVTPAQFIASADSA